MNEQLDKMLKWRRIRPTVMRELVLRILKERKSAISLPELELEFEKVDKATLYRTLKTFEENKLIHSIHDGTGSVKYALCNETCECEPADQHVHFLCDSCRHIFCLNDISIPNISLPENFTMHHAELLMKGICADCRN